MRGVPTASLDAATQQFGFFSQSNNLEWPPIAEALSSRLYIPPYAHPVVELLEPKMLEIFEEIARGEVWYFVDSKKYETYGIEFKEVVV